MVRQLFILFVVLTLFDLSCTKYSRAPHQRFRRTTVLQNTTNPSTHITIDDYYDWYHYDLSSGYQHRTTLKFIVLLVTLSVFVMT